MKKGFLIVSVIILLSLIIVILFNLKDSISMSDSNNISEKVDSIEFFVTNSTPKLLKYKIVNNSSYDVIFGEEYSIEKNIDGVWKSYNIAIDFIEIANILKPKELVEREIVFATTYGNLDKGEYRLLKRIDGKLLEAKFEIK